MPSNRFLLSLLLAGCAGKAPGISDQPDAPTATADAPPVTVDAPPVALGEKVSGKAIDYFTNLAVPTAMVTTDGITPPLTATSGTDGTYEVDNVASGSKIFLSAIRTNYKLTTNLVTSVLASPVMQDIYLLSGPDIKRQYTSVGLASTAGDGKAIVVIELVANDGSILTGLTGIPATGIQLLDATQTPVTTGGIFFVGAAGDVDQAVTTSTAYVFPTGTPSRARAAILGVPAGTYTLKVTYGPTATPVTMTSSLTTAADNAVLVRTGSMAMTTGPTDPTFATDIYPKLQKAANGGLGCANCHTAGGQGAVLQYDLPAATVLANMKAITGVIDLTTPADSLLLVRPLYEPPPTPQDHPNATFLDTNDPDYKLFLLWITNGAKP